MRQCSCIKGFVKGVPVVRTSSENAGTPYLLERLHNIWKKALKSNTKRKWRKFMKIAEKCSSSTCEKGGWEEDNKYPRVGKKMRKIVGKGGEKMTSGERRGGE